MQCKTIKREHLEKIISPPRTFEAVISLFWFFFREIGLVCSKKIREGAINEQIEWEIVGGLMLVEECSLVV